MARITMAIRATANLPVAFTPCGIAHPLMWAFRAVFPRPCSKPLLQPHPDALDLRVREQFVQTFLPADAALLDAAVGRAQRVAAGDVHPDVPRLDPPRDPVSLGVVMSVHCCAEAVDH